MPHALTPRSQWPPADRSTSRISYALVRRRTHTLGLADALLDTCTTVGEMQALLRPLYRARALVTHPDHLPGHATWRDGSQVRGVVFQRLHKAYTWLMALAPGQRLQRLPALPAPVLEHDYPDIGRGFHVLYV